MPKVWGRLASCARAPRTINSLGTSPRRALIATLTSSALMVSGCSKTETTTRADTFAAQNAAQMQELSFISTKPLALRDAIKLGVLSSASVKNADVSLAIKENEIAISKSAYYPELFANIGPSVEDGELATGSVGIQYTLYDFGERAAQLRASRADAKRARYEILGEVDTSVTDTTLGYIDLAAARRQIAIAYTHAKAINALESRVRSRVEFGAAPEVDLKEIRIAKLDAATREAEAANERDDAKAELSSRIGVAPTSVESIEALRSLLTLADAKYTIDTTSYPKVAARAEELNAAIHTRDAAVAGLFPKIRAKASAGLDISNSGTVAGTGVSVGPDIGSTISLGGANKKRRENAELNVAIAEQNFDEEIRLTRLAAQQAKIEFDAAQAEISRRKSILRLARNKRRLLIEEYEVGTRTLKDLVDVEEEIFNKNQSLVKAYARDLVARLDLLKAMNQASSRLYVPASSGPNG